MSSLKQINSKSQPKLISLDTGTFNMIAVSADELLTKSKLKEFFQNKKVNLSIDNKSLSHQKKEIFILKNEQDLVSYMSIEAQIRLSVSSLSAKQQHEALAEFHQLLKVLKLSEIELFEKNSRDLSEKENYVIQFFQALNSRKKILLIDQFPVSFSQAETKFLLDKLAYLAHSKGKVVLFFALEKQLTYPHDNLLFAN